jgi:hypothetical protein
MFYLIFLIFVAMLLWGYRSAAVVLFFAYIAYLVLLKWIQIIRYCRRRRPKQVGAPKKEPLELALTEKCAAWAKYICKQQNVTKYRLFSSSDQRFLFVVEDGGWKSIWAITPVDNWTAALVKLVKNPSNIYSIAGGLLPAQMHLEYDSSIPVYVATTDDPAETDLLEQICEAKTIKIRIVIE